MKKHYMNKHLAVLCLISLALTVSCSKDTLKENLTTDMTADKLYSTQEGFELGLNGLYSVVRGEREGYGYTDSFGGTGLRALMYTAGTDTYNCGAGASGEFSAIPKDWAKANVPTDRSLSSVFSWLYNAVLTANTIITRAENPEIVWTAGTKERVLGEARLLRAWAYRHLTYMWGDVPLVKEEVTGDTFRTDYTRDALSVVRAQIIEDLEYAVKYVPWQPSAIGRATKGVAYTWLSEIYLAEAGISEYDTALLQKAYDAADSCIVNGPYALITSRMGSEPGTAFTDQFKPENVNIESGNTEALWVMQWEKGSVGGGDNLMRFSFKPKFDTSGKTAANVNLSYYDESRGGRGFARTSVTKWALELYDKSSDRANGIVDDRGSEYAIAKYFVLSELDEIEDASVNMKTGVKYAPGDTVFIGCSKVADAGLRASGCMNSFAGLKSGSSEGDNNNWPFTLKFNYCDPGYPKTNESHNDQVFMRLAEVYLLRAEAAFKLNDKTQAAADINVLRNRAHAVNVTEANLTSIDFILEERARELLAEEQRRYTLRRMMGAEDFVEWITARNGKDKNMTTRDYLFPIPQSAIDANIHQKMEQNPGF